MCVKASISVLILSYFFVHACHARSFAATTSISDTKSDHPTKIEVRLKSSMSYTSNRILSEKAATLNTKETEDICKKNKGIEGTTSVVFSRSEDCKSSHHRLPQHYSKKSEGSRLPRLNVREMELHTPFFKEEDLSATDYQPPHRKAPIHNK